MIAEGIIRKISVGDLKNGITYMIGQRMFDDALEIVSIQLDVDSTNQLNMLKYDILVKSNKSEHIRKWKSFSGMAVAVEYDLTEFKDV